MYSRRLQYVLVDAIRYKADYNQITQRNLFHRSFFLQ